MKFDVFSWDEVKPNVKIEVGKGPLRLQCSAQTALYVEAEGVEALAGLSAAHHIEVAEEVTIRLETAAKGVRCFLFRPATTTAVEPHGEVYTNIDRMSDESGTMAEITKARRQFELERRAILREMKVEHAKLRAAMKAETPLQQTTEPVIEPIDDDQSKTEAEA